MGAALSGPPVRGSELGIGLPPGSHHYRAFVGPAERYDLQGALQFSLLTALGLREHHTLLDIGCGSCRAGRLFLPYLLPGRYHGLEPERWLVEQGIERELGHDIVAVKRPIFRHERDFALTAFDRSFDFLLAQSVFSHASPAQIRRCLSEARRVLAPTGIFVATYRPGPHDYAGTEWVYPQVVSYRPAFMRRLIREAELGSVPLDWPHPGGQTWLAIVPAGREHRVPRVRSFHKERRWLRRLVAAGERTVRRARAARPRAAGPVSPPAPAAEPRP
jgi:SAM-dependent methyltransferase